MWAWIWTLTWTQGMQAVSSASRPTDPCHPHITRRQPPIHRASRRGCPPCPRSPAWAVPTASRSPGWRAAEGLRKIGWPVRLDYMSRFSAYVRKQAIIMTNIDEDGQFICCWLLRSVLSATLRKWFHSLRKLNERLLHWEQFLTADCCRFSNDFSQPKLNS